MPSAPPPYLLWCDPGGQTGLATLIRGDFWAGEYPFSAACDQVTSLCDWIGPALHIGWERFTIRPVTHKLSPQPDAYEFPGVLRYLAHRYGCTLLPPAQAHTPDARDQAELKALGWWTPGLDDAQSAAAHLLRWLKRENCVPPEQARILAGLR